MDRANGKGTYTWPDGRKYIGFFENDKMEHIIDRRAKEKSLAEFTWPNGDKYVGEFKDNKMHGLGRLI